VAELAFDHDQRHAFAGHFHRMCTAQLMSKFLPAPVVDPDLATSSSLAVADKN
jgi:hypothetical protein